ncbi:MAG TPA: TIGR03067 domain-containing protein [Gemmatales bacterium]|nr:TIGR03067 domain-containing protein [Gemmatales bacterium]
MLRLSIAALSCLLLVAHVWADDKEEAAKKEQEKFQGEWKLAGQDEVSLKITGAEYLFTLGDMKEKGKMKFNPAAKPNEVDVEITEGTDMGRKQVGIYEWKGDKVKFCFAKAGEAKRPDKFEASDDGSLILFEFEKVKK